MGQFLPEICNVLFFFNALSMGIVQVRGSKLMVLCMEVEVRGGLQIAFS